MEGLSLCKIRPLYIGRKFWEACNWQGKTGARLYAIFRAWQTSTTAFFRQVPRFDYRHHPTCGSFDKTQNPTTTLFRIRQISTQEAFLAKYTPFIGRKKSSPQKGGRQAPKKWTADKYKGYGKMSNRLGRKKGAPKNRRQIRSRLCVQGADFSLYKICFLLQRKRI